MEDEDEEDDEKKIEKIGLKLGEISIIEKDISQEKILNKP